MSTWIDQLLGDTGPSSQLSLTATADHVELSEASLVIGLALDWRNRADRPIPIKEIQAMVHPPGRKEAIVFYPLERFERMSAQKALQKTPARPFALPPKESYKEHLRFISQEIVDLAPGSYSLDIKITDISDTVYTNRAKIRVENKIKYRRNEDWQHEE